MNYRQRILHHKWFSVCRRAIALSAALLLLVAVSSFTQTAVAQTPDLEIVFVNGKAVQFHIEKVTIPNLSDARVKALMHAFTMTVTMDGVQVFRGRCDELPEPLFAPVLIHTQGPMQMNIILEFDKWAGNMFQGIPYTIQFQFASVDEEMHQIHLSKKVFNVNGNVNPGDRLQYQIVADYFAAGDHSGTPPWNPPTETTDMGGAEASGRKDSTGVTGGYSNTNPFNPPNDNSSIRTGGFLEQAVTEHLDTVLIVLSVLVIGCIVLVLVLPIKQRKKREVQER